MNKVNIELSEEQYKTLLELIYLGEWVGQSYSEKSSEAVEEIEQIVYKTAKETDSKDLIEYDEKTKRYFPTVDMEEKMLEYIDEYDDNVFWDELVDRLAEKDLINKFGEEKISKMSFEERIEEEDPFIEKYEDEFSKNGIENLKLDKD